MLGIVNDLLGLVEDVGQVAATAVLAVVHGSHEDTGTALRKSVSELSRRLAMNSRSKKLTVSAGHSRRRRSILPSPSTL
jgi:hypothetical protein